jgi:dihydrofolate reductase
VRIGGGPATVRQYMQAGLVDELHIAQSPTLLGSGEPVFAGMDWTKLGFRVAEHVATGQAIHLLLRK